MKKIIVGLLAYALFIPLAVHAQGGTGVQTPSPSIQSDIPKLDVNNIIDTQRFRDIVKKNIDISKLESIMRKKSDQPRSGGEKGITADLVVSFIKDAARELLHSIGGLIYNLMHLLGLEKYLRYLPRF